MPDNELDKILYESRKARGAYQSPGARLDDFVAAQGGYVTSSTGGKHVPNSKHYSDKARDVRVKDKPLEWQESFRTAAEAEGFRVLDERKKPGQPHYHIEASDPQEELDQVLQKARQTRQQPVAPPPVAASPKAPPQPTQQLPPQSAPQFDFKQRQPGQRFDFSNNTKADAAKLQVNKPVSRPRAAFDANVNRKPVAGEIVVRQPDGTVAPTQNEPGVLERVTRHAINLAPGLGAAASAFGVDVGKPVMEGAKEIGRQAEEFSDLPGDWSNVGIEAAKGFRKAVRNTPQAAATLLDIPIRTATRMLPDDPYGAKKTIEANLPLAEKLQPWTQAQNAETDRVYQEQYGIDPNKRTKSSVIGGSLGQSIPLLAGGAAGLGAKGVAAIGAGMNAQQAYAEARSKGATPEEASRAATIAAPIGALEGAFGAEAQLAKAGVSRVMARKAAEVLKNAPAEVGQEVLTEALNNINKAYLSGYAPDTKLLDGMVEAAIGSLGMTGAIGGAGLAARGVNRAANALNVDAGPIQGAITEALDPAAAAAQQRAARSAVEQDTRDTVDRIFEQVMAEPAAAVAKQQESAQANTAQTLAQVAAEEAPKNPQTADLLGSLDKTLNAAKKPAATAAVRPQPSTSARTRSAVSQPVTPPPVENTAPLSPQERQQFHLLGRMTDEEIDAIPPQVARKLLPQQEPIAAPQKPQTPEEAAYARQLTGLSRKVSPEMLSVTPEQYDAQLAKLEERTPAPEPKPEPQSPEEIAYLKQIDALTQKAPEAKFNVTPEQYRSQLSKLEASDRAMTPREQEELYALQLRDLERPAIPEPLPKRYVARGSRTTPPPAVELGNASRPGNNLDVQDALRKPLRQNRTADTPSARPQAETLGQSPRGATNEVTLDKELAAFDAAQQEQVNERAVPQRTTQPVRPGGQVMGQGGAGQSPRRTVGTESVARPSTVRDTAARQGFDDINLDEGFQQARGVAPNDRLGQDTANRIPANDRRTGRLDSSVPSASGAAVESEAQTRTTRSTAPSVPPQEQVNDTPRTSRSNAAPDGSATAGVQEASVDEFYQRIDSTPNTVATSERQEDWGTLRGQGKRSGGQVLGSMSNAPRGKKTYTSKYASLPEYTKENGADFVYLEDNGQGDAYLKARSAGLSHDDAMVYAYEQVGDAPKGSTYERIRKNEVSERPVSDGIGNQITGESAQGVGDSTSAETGRGQTSRQDSPTGETSRGFSPQEQIDPDTDRRQQRMRERADLVGDRKQNIGDFGQVHFFAEKKLTDDQGNELQYSLGNHPEWSQHLEITPDATTEQVLDAIAQDWGGKVRSSELTFDDWKRIRQTYGGNWSEDLAKTVAATTAAAQAKDAKWERFSADEQVQKLIATPIPPRGMAERVRALLKIAERYNDDKTTTNITKGRIEALLKGQSRPSVAQRTVQGTPARDTERAETQPTPDAATRSSEPRTPDRTGNTERAGQSADVAGNESNEREVGEDPRLSEDRWKENAAQYLKDADRLAARRKRRGGNIFGDEELTQHERNREILFELFRKHREQGEAFGNYLQRLSGTDIRPRSVDFVSTATRDAIRKGLSTPDTAPLRKPEAPLPTSNARAQALYDKAKAALEKGTGESGNPLSPAARKSYEDDLRKYGKVLGLPEKVEEGEKKAAEVSKFVTAFNETRQRIIENPSYTRENPGYRQGSDLPALVTVESLRESFQREVLNRARSLTYGSVRKVDKDSTQRFLRDQINQAGFAQGVHEVFGKDVNQAITPERIEANIRAWADQHNAVIDAEQAARESEQKTAAQAKLDKETAFLAAKGLTAEQVKALTPRKQAILKKEFDAFTVPPQDSSGFTTSALGAGAFAKFNDTDLRTVARHFVAHAKSFSDWARAMVKDFGAAIRPRLRQMWDGLQTFYKDERGVLDEQAVIDGIKNLARRAGFESNAEYGARKRAEMEASPEFKKWFAGSKVVDENGKPLIVYHGTRSGSFSVFNQEILGRSTGHPAASLGFYFTREPHIADLFVKDLSKTVFDASRAPIGDQAQVMPSYLRIKNPKVISGDDFRDLFVDERYSNRTPESFRKMREKWQAEGFDGIFIKADQRSWNPSPGLEEYGGDSYVAFSPTQIKSAFNRGTFDPNDPNISHDIGSATAKAVSATVKGLRNPLDTPGFNDTSIRDDYDFQQYADSLMRAVKTSTKENRMKLAPEDYNWMARMLPERIFGRFSAEGAAKRTAQQFSKHFADAVDAFNNGDSAKLVEAQRELAIVVQAPKHKIMADLFRPLMLGAELSFVGIQGGVNLMSHPVRTYRAALLGLKAASPSPDVKGFFDNFLQNPKATVSHLIFNDSTPMYGKVVQAIRNHPRTALGKKAGLELDTLADLDPTVSIHEKTEGFAVTGIRKLPLWRQTERFGRAFGDALRLQAFDQNAKLLESKGLKFEKNPEPFKEAARVANIFSGRGDFGRFQGAAHALSYLGTSPRLVVSQFQILNPMEFMRVYNSDPLTLKAGLKGTTKAADIAAAAWNQPLLVKERAKDLTKVAAFSATLLGLAVAAGWETPTDPDDPKYLMAKRPGSDFAIGIVPSSLRPQIKYVHRLWKNFGELEQRGISGVLSESKRDTLNYLSNKTAPLPSLIKDQATEYRKNRYADPVPADAEVKGRPDNLIKGGLRKLSPAAYEWLDKKTRFGYGTDFIGRPVTVLDSVTSRMNPIYWNTLYEAWRNEYLTTGEKTARSGFEFFGHATSDVVSKYQSIKLPSDLEAEFKKHRANLGYISQEEGESRKDWEARAGRVQQMLADHLPKLTAYDAYKKADDPTRKKALESLKRRIADFETGAANQKAPDLPRLNPAVIFEDIKTSEKSQATQKARAGRNLVSTVK